MKRKREKKLNPCEEKALVHLQALQIKEKEAKARKRAKKRKEVSSTTLTGQNIPYQQQPVPTQDVSPFDFRPSTQTYTRNEWDQLIPATLQTAQFMILNHAMSRQGQWNQASQLQQDRAPVMPAPPIPPVVGAPSEIEMADLSAPQRRLIGQRRGPIRAPVGVPTGVINTAQNVGRAVGRGLVAIARGTVRGTAAVGRGLSAIGTGAARVATSIGGAIDKVKEARQIRKFNQTSQRIMNQYQESIELDAMRQNRIKDLAASIQRDKTLPNYLYKDEFMERFPDTTLFKNDIPYSTKPIKIDKPIPKTSGKASQVMNAWRQARGTIGSAIDRVKEQLENRKQLQAMRKQAIKDKVIELESLNKDVTQPNNKAVNVGKFTTDLQNMLDENKPIPPLEPMTPVKKTSEVVTEGVTTPINPISNVGVMGQKSPYLKFTVSLDDDEYKSKVQKGDSDQNARKLVEVGHNNQSHLQNLYKAVVKGADNEPRYKKLLRYQTSPEPYVKIDNNWMLNQDGVIVSRVNPQSFHPYYDDLIERELSARFTPKTPKTYRSTPVVEPHSPFARMIHSHKDVLNFLNDRDNIAAGKPKEFYQRIASSREIINELPVTITPAHQLSSEGELSYNRNVSYNENEESPHSDELTQQYWEESNLISGEYSSPNRDLPNFPEEEPIPPPNFEIIE